MDRIDQLLDTYLETGEIPADATPDERAELGRMARAAGLLRTSKADIDAEAVAAKPVARARFERHIQAARQPARPVAPARPERFFGLPRNVGLALAGLAVVVVVAISANRVMFTGAETVNALEPGDYAEVEGVVTAAEGEGNARTLRVETAVGVLTVNADESTLVVDDEDAVGLDSVEPGVAVLVAGIVGDGRVITARTLALSQGDAERPVRSALRRFDSADVGLVGSIVSVSLAADGTHALVVLEGEGERRWVVEVEEHTASRLLAAQRAIGLRVRVIEGAAGRFAFEGVGATPEPTATTTVDGTVPPGRPDRPGAEEPSVVAVEGRVAAASAGEVVIITLRGRVRVTIDDATRVLPGMSALTEAEIREGNALIGRLVAVRGGLDPATGNVRADVLVAGREPLRSP